MFNFIIGIIIGMIIMDYLYYKKFKSTSPYTYYIKTFFKNIKNFFNKGK